MVRSRALTPVRTSRWHAPPRGQARKTWSSRSELLFPSHGGSPSVAALQCIACIALHFVALQCKRIGLGATLQCCNARARGGRIVKRGRVGSPPPSPLRRPRTPALTPAKGPPLCSRAPAGNTLAKDAAKARRSRLANGTFVAEIPFGERDLQVSCLTFPSGASRLAALGSRAARTPSICTAPPGCRGSCNEPN
jgi:hypothetical protein